MCQRKHAEAPGDPLPCVPQSDCAAAPYLGELTDGGGVMHRTVVFGGVDKDTVTCLTSGTNRVTSSQSEGMEAWAVVRQADFSGYEWRQTL